MIGARQMECWLIRSVSADDPELQPTMMDPASIQQQQNKGPGQFGDARLSQHERCLLY